MAGNRQHRDARERVRDVVRQHGGVMGVTTGLSNRVKAGWATTQTTQTTQTAILA